VAEKPRSRQDVSVDGKKVPASVDAPTKLKKRRATSEARTEHSDMGGDDEKVSKKKRSKKKARPAEVEQQPPPVPKKRGQPRKPVEEKASKAVAVAGSQPFNASVFVSVEKPPQLMRGKTHKTDKHVAQEPCVEGPFTLIRSMKWADFLDEVTGWVGVDKENLRIHGLSWGFQKQKARLPLTSEQAFKTLREQVKAKNSSATVIFVYHPICKQPQSRGQEDNTDQVPVTVQDETRWDKKVSRLIAQTILYKSCCRLSRAHAAVLNLDKP